MSEPQREFVWLMSARVRELLADPSGTVAADAAESIDADATLADALLAMVRRRLPALTVVAAGRVVGRIDALDLLGRVANHSHLAGLQIDGASLEELAAAARRIEQFVVSLHESGIDVGVIGRRASDLNGRLYARLWRLVAPPELVEASCLIVMGSEGRGEQIVRTDQDNALLLRDGVDPAVAEDAARRFNSALIEFGYPPCSGNVMVTNALWRQPIGEFKETIRSWIYGGATEGVMQLAIFVDAARVAGDAGLLAEARAYLDRILVDNQAWFARFASAVDLFPEPAGWWTRLAALAGREEPPLDLKKHGTFPIVHGLRALALEHRIAATSSGVRLRQLLEGGHLPAELGRDLADVLPFLTELKLKNHLRQRRLGEPPDPLVRPAELGLLDRDRLRDSLVVVQQFRHFLHQHYRLEAL